MLIIPLLAITLSFLTHIVVFVFAAPIPLNDVSLKARALTPRSGERQRADSALGAILDWKHVNASVENAAKRTAAGDNFFGTSSKGKYALTPSSVTASERGRRKSASETLPDRLHRTSLPADRPSLPVTDHFITPTVRPGVEDDAKRIVGTSALKGKDALTPSPVTGKKRRPRSKSAPPKLQHARRPRVRAKRVHTKGQEPDPLTPSPVTHVTGKRRRRYSAPATPKEPLTPSQKRNARRHGNRGLFVSGQEPATPKGPLTRNQEKKARRRRNRGQEPDARLTPSPVTPVTGERRRRHSAPAIPGLHVRPGVEDDGKRTADALTPSPVTGERRNSAPATPKAPPSGKTKI